jgi:hypothetical protein
MNFKPNQSDSLRSLPDVLSIRFEPGKRDLSMITINLK